MSNWISIYERLPANDDSVIVCIKFVCDYSVESQFEIEVMSEHPEAWKGANNPKNKCNWYVTHWMPLPEAPK